MDPDPSIPTLDEFFDVLRARLAKGAAEYGDKSFAKPTPTSAAEILEEILDVAGWAFVHWVAMRRRLHELDLAAQRLEITAKADLKELHRAKASGRKKVGEVDQEAPRDRNGHQGGRSSSGSDMSLDRWWEEG